MSSPRIICDTNIIINALRGDTKILAEFNRLGFSRFVLSSVTVGEVYNGMFKGEIRATKELLRQFDHYPIDKTISRQYESLTLNHYGRVAVGDGLIGATALVTGYPLYTLNKIDFHFMGVGFYVPRSFTKP